MSTSSQVAAYGDTLGGLHIWAQSQGGIKPTINSMSQVSSLVCFFFSIQSLKKTDGVILGS